MVDGGLLHRADSTVRALIDVRPYGADDGPWWVASDLGTGLDGVDVPLREDHVLGVGGASTTLAQLTVRPSVGRALDVGTGCGVQSLHLSTHVDEVVATDLSQRALGYAAVNAALAGLDDQWRGLSLTMPLKEAALRTASHVTATAADTGVANTLVHGPEGWTGYNTDVHGIAVALREAGCHDPTHAMIVGSGATARSAVAAAA